MDIILVETATNQLANYGRNFVVFRLAGASSAIPLGWRNEAFAKVRAAAIVTLTPACIAAKIVKPGARLALYAL